MKVAQCGSLESNDCLITVTPSTKTEIVVQSIVEARFGDQIRETISHVLTHSHITCHVHIVDQGAYDYTIEARLKTALRRMNNE